MTYTIPPDSPKAVKAAAFGRELVKACKARGIPRSELWRSTGIGRTAMDNYRTGSSLPRTETAATLATALRWPKLLEIVRAARTRPCRRCGAPFTNEGGNQGAKRYCSPDCRRIAVNEAQASRRIRQAGQTDDNRRRYQALARLRSGIRIADEGTAGRQVAIDAMCASCEPDGVCRLADCPLRPFSPLPLAVHLQRAELRTEFEIRSMARSRPEVVASASAKMRAWHADPANAALHSERLLAAFAQRTPEAREAWIAKIAATKAARRSTNPASDGSGPRRPTPPRDLSAAPGVRPPLPPAAAAGEGAA